MDKITTYILIMLCVILTAIAVGIAFFVIYLIKVNVIDDIISDIKDYRDNYWKKRFHEELDKSTYWQGLFYKFNVPYSTAERLIMESRKCEWLSPEENSLHNGNALIRISFEVAPEERKLTQ